MNREERIEEILRSMKSFVKQKYRKDELLQECFLLQEEMGGLTYREEHARQGNLKLWDVRYHLERLNEERGHVADAELARFKVGCRTVSNLIKAEVSGNRGERKAFHALKYIKSPHCTLHNLELESSGIRTEIDALILTPKAAFIVEVKNTRRDIFIDESGDYYRTGEYLNRDSNIAEKLDRKEQVFLEVLHAAGIETDDMEVIRIVVFTDNRISVRNCYKGAKTCFLSHLSYIIDGYEGQEVFTEGELEEMADIIDGAEKMEAYPIEAIDMNQFKRDFAETMAALESEEQIQECAEIRFVEKTEEETEENTDSQSPIWPTVTVVVTALAAAAAWYFSKNRNGGLKR